MLTIWCALFFRDPVRVTPVREGIVVAPADGRISMITQAMPPAELGLGDKPLPRISIFMSVFNCHVNRSPVSGRIDRIAYRPGDFINAELDKASEDNERNSLVISSPNGRIGVIQIAGLVARRIVSFVREGQTIGAGERFGLIRFGSRLDVFLPEGTTAAGLRGPDRGRRRDHPGRFPARATPAALSGPINPSAAQRSALGRNGGAGSELAIFGEPMPECPTIPAIPNCAAAGFVRSRCGCWCPTSSRCSRSAPA